jgi:hypothetical protein
MIEGNTLQGLLLRRSALQHMMHNHKALLQAA